MDKFAEGAVDEKPSVVVAGWAGAGNVGDELLARWVLLELKKHGARPVLLSSDPTESTAIHSVESVDSRSLRAVTSAIRNADGLVFGPGGIVQDSSSVWSLPFHLWRPFVARRTSTPWVGVGLGVDPFRRHISRLMARRVMSHAITTTVRDAESARVLEELDLETDLGDDVVFGLPVSDRGHRDVVAVAVGPEIDQSASRWRTAAGRLDMSDVELVASALSQVRSSTGMPIILASFRGTRDLDFASEVCAAMGGDVDVEHVDVDSAASWCASAGVLITSRFHPAVMAVSHHRPTVVWARSPKIVSLATRCPQSMVEAPPERWPRAVDEARGLCASASPYVFDTSPHERAVAALVERIGAAS